MSRHEARLAWSLVLSPPAPPVGDVCWPRFLLSVVPDLRRPPADPLAAVVDGAFGHQVLRRLPLGDGCSLIVSGLGDAVGVTVAVREPGEALAAVDLRGRAVAALGLEGAFGDDEAAVEAALRSAAGPWALEGLVEVEAELLEGLPEDLDPSLPAAEVGTVQIVRAGGVGPGHAAWTLTGAFGRRTEGPVAQRAVSVLSEGHLGRVPAMLAYGAAALRFGATLRRAGRQMAALDGLLPTVEAACAWSTSRGPWAGPGASPPYSGLRARLALLRVGLQESHEALAAARVPLTEAAGRALCDRSPEPGGPFVEASSRGQQAMDRVLGRVDSVGRWAGALALAEDASR